MGVGSSYERSSVPMRPVRVVETTVEDTVLLGEDAVGMVESDVAMVVAGRRSPRKKSAKKSAKKSPAKKSAKKSPAKKSAKKMKMHTYGK
jgi:topoisomerase IA-like protein